MDLNKSRVAVQGFGNAGSIAARLISEEGSTVVAVSDSTGGIHNPAGLDIAKVDRPGRASTAPSRASPGATDITNAEVLEVDCDILIPAALENQISPATPAGSRPGSSPRRPTARPRPEADEILFKKGVFLIPDILCNAGGVTVSYFEWVQDLNRDHWSESVVNAKLKEIMVKAFGETLDDREPRAGQHADRRLPARGQARRGRDGDARPLPVSRASLHEGLAAGGPPRRNVCLRHGPGRYGWPVKTSRSGEPIVRLAGCCPWRPRRREARV